MKTRNSGIISLLVAIILLSGCASSSGIQKYAESSSNFNTPPQLIAHNYPAEDIYRVYKKGGSAIKQVDQIRKQLERQIADFAKKKGRSFVILGQQSVNPGFGRFPGVEIVFALTDKK